MTTAFFAKSPLWREMRARVEGARRVDVAVAYLGHGAADLLPLKKGHRLVIDMSLTAVRAGSTDPNEVERLIAAGVDAYSRQNLHAKMLIADGVLVCGSANISHHSRDILEEAGISTDEPAAVRAAHTFFESICTEPIRPEYLSICKKEYRPPQGFGGRPSGSDSETDSQPSPARHRKLWLVNLSEFELPKSEEKRFKLGLSAAQKLIKDPATTKVESFYWPSKPLMASQLVTGDWIIQAMTLKSKRIRVYPPGQFLSMDHYPRGETPDKERWVFHIEVPRSGQGMTWSRFRNIARQLPGLEKWTSPRTRAIKDNDVADKLLALWTSTGELA